jgi:basic amino acid/polyamine antiporter, APA family
MLKKQLGVFNVFSLAAGAMISSGLFVLPGIAFEKAGPAIIFAYALAGLLMLPVLLSTAELATAMPKSGGSYFFVERSMGPLAGTVAGFSIWLAIALKAAFAMVGIGALTAELIPDSGEWTIKIVASIGCVLFMLLNLFSVKGAGKLQSVLVIALVCILAGYSLKGFNNIEVTNYEPFNPSGLAGILAVTGMVFVSFGGLTKVVDISEEIHNPDKNLPLGMFGAFIIVMTLYVVVVFITIGIVPAEKLSGSLIPIGLGGEAIMGKLGKIIIGLAAFFAFATTGNAGILSASRTPMAMSRDGLVPEIFSRTSKRFSTPTFSILITTGFMVTVILAFSVEDLVKTASTIMILMFMLMNASVVIMHYSRIQTYRPTFKAPLKPYMQIVTIIVYIFLIAEMGKIPLLISGGFALLASLWYLFYVERRIGRESAILYLVRGILSRHIERSGLEEELKLLALERDQITPDRFDKLIKKCDILDITESITAKKLFREAAEIMSSKVEMNSDDLYRLFLERENESTTIVKPGLAIPHIVIGGQNKFEILLVRCKDGIIFSDLHEPVRTAFILMGSQNERNYHLRALMNIAHIVSEPEFDDRWAKAVNTEQLRDIVLLSTRKRD